MKNIWIIYKKEMSGIFYSPLFYILAFFLTLILSITFSMGLSRFLEEATLASFQMIASTAQQKNIHYAVFLQHLSWMNLIFIFLVPLLSMRMISEEKKNRTFDLLLTSPITSAQIVAGKFFTLLSVIFSLTVLALIYIAFVQTIAEFNWSTILLATSGIVLVGALYAAIDLFASSLTENSLVSLFLAIMFNMGVWIIGTFATYIDNEWLRNAYSQFSASTHLELLIEGVFKLNSLVYFSTVIFLFCFLTERMIESLRWKG